MATANMYATSLREANRSHDKPSESGVTYFVSHLAKVKTAVVCQTNNKHLLFSYEKGATSSDNNGDLHSPTTAALPYRRQGNKSYYTDENLRKRHTLLSDRNVIAGIARFWDTFPCVRQGERAIAQRDYIDVFMKFYKALVAPNEFSIGEARRIVERDWGRDVSSSSSDAADSVMSKELFFRSLFEVADIWTVGISSDEYTSFLRKLFERVTMKLLDRTTSVWTTVFAELDRIRSFAEPKERNVNPDDVVLLEIDEDADVNQENEKARQLLTHSVGGFESYVPQILSPNLNPVGAAITTGRRSAKGNKASAGSSSATISSISRSSKPPLRAKKTKTKMAAKTLTASDSSRGDIVTSSNTETTTAMSAGGDPEAAALPPTTMTPRSTALGSLRRLPELVSLSPAAPSACDDETTAGQQPLGPSTSSLRLRLSTSSDAIGDNESAAASTISAASKQALSQRSSTRKLLNDKRSQRNLTGGGGGNGSNTSSAVGANSAGRQAMTRSGRFESSGSLKTDAFTSPATAASTSSRGDVDAGSQRIAAGDSNDDEPSAIEVSGSATARAGQLPSSTTADLPSQPIRLAMPSIYLSPDDLAESHATVRAARRRIRESSKLAQRLRRITF